MGVFHLSIVYTILLIERYCQCSATTYSGCSPGRQRVISYNTTLVPPSGISASSQAVTFNPDNNLFHRNNLPLRLWCTDKIHGGMEGLAEGWSFSELLQNGSLIYDINVTFSEPLLLTHILSSGFSNGYVNNFTITQSLEEGGPLLPYNHSRERKEFVVANIDTVFELRPPLAARRIRFNILDGLVTSNGQLCWHLTLLGCTLPEAASSQNTIFWNSNNSISQNTSLPSLIPDCTLTDLTPHPTAISSSSPSSISSSSPSSISSSFSTLSTTPNISPPSSFPSPSTSTSDAQREVITTSIPTSNTKSSCDHRIVLIVVPMAIASLLLLAFLMLVCVCTCLCCKYNSPHLHPDEYCWNIGGETAAIRDVDPEFPEGQIDALGMVDNEMYESRSSMYPPSKALVKHMPTLDNKNGSSTYCNGGGNALANMSSEAIYENCDSSVISAYQASRFGDSMNPRSTCTTELEQSVDSMVDNPTYSVPFPTDYHSVKPFPKRNPFPPILAMSSLTTGASCIDMVDNECYRMPSSQNRQDDMEQNLVAGIQEPPLDYETPK